METDRILDSLLEGWKSSIELTASEIAEMRREVLARPDLGVDLSVAWWRRVLTVSCPQPRFAYPMLRG